MDARLFFGPGATLSWHLGMLIRRAERRYGPRNRTYWRDGREHDSLICGVEFFDGTPHIWFPQFGDGEGIGVRLSAAHADDRRFTLQSLAHEAVHCLSPVPASEGTVLEEALATVFADRFSIENGWGPYARGPYKVAADLLEPLLHDADVIRRIREKTEPTISRIGVDTLLRYCPTLSPATASRLTEKSETFFAREETEADHATQCQ